MPAEPGAEEPSELKHLTREDIDFMSKAMRGVKSAKARFFETDKAFEDELIALLLALDVSVQSEKVTRIAPAPLRRYSIQFVGSSAKITVTQRRAILG